MAHGAMPCVFWLLGCDPIGRAKCIQQINHPLCGGATEVNWVLNQKYSRWSKKMVDFLHAECYSEAYSDDKYTIYDEQGSDELDGKGI